jgi:hypothetical protein
MNRTLTTAALSVLLAIAVFPASQAAETINRYRVVREPSQSAEVRVSKTGSAWFSGTDAQGKVVTVVFQSRFASVERDGALVPVSYLRAGDTVEVVGQVAGSRLVASAARVTQSRTAKAQQAKATASCCWASRCAGSGWTETSCASCGGGESATCAAGCCG